MSELDDFLRWCNQFKGFPGGQMGYWRDAFRRHDGTDMYGQKLQPMATATGTNRPTEG